MNPKIYSTFDDFYRITFDGKDVLATPYDVFEKNLKSRGKPIREWFESLKDDDPRKVDPDTVLRNMHAYYYGANGLRFLKKWWAEMAEVTDVNYMFSQHKSIPQFDGQTLEAKIISPTGRLVKNIFWQDIYQNTMKSTYKGKPTTINLFRHFYLDFDIRDTVYLQPSSVKFYNPDYRTELMGHPREKKRVEDYETCRNMVAYFRGTIPSASVFYPEVYRYVIDEVIIPSANPWPPFKDDMDRWGSGKLKLLTPVMSWCSPVFAFVNSHRYEHLTSIDVMPQVLDKSKVLFHDIQESMRNSGVMDFDTLEVSDGPLDHKTFETWCCPSEKLAERTDFLEKNRGRFDVVFFSPPYYDVELYPGGEQSTDSYRSYTEWLDGYWRGTVELCHEALSEGGVFSFAIVPHYSSRDGTIPISEDMRKIAADVFGTQVAHRQISWGGFKLDPEINIGEKKRDMKDDVWIFRKGKVNKAV